MKLSVRQKKYTRTSAIYESIDSSSNGKEIYLMDQTP